MSVPAPPIPSPRPAPERCQRHPTYWLASCPDCATAHREKAGAR